MAGTGLGRTWETGLAATYIRRNRPIKAGRSTGASRLCRILRMIPIPTRRSGVENDSHYQVVQVYSRQVKIEKISTFFRV